MSHYSCWLYSNKTNTEIVLLWQTTNDFLLSKQYPRCVLMSASSSQPSESTFHDLKTGFVAQKASSIVNMHNIYLKVIGTNSFTLQPSQLFTATSDICESTSLFHTRCLHYCLLRYFIPLWLVTIMLEVFCYYSKQPRPALCKFLTQYFLVGRRKRLTCNIWKPCKFVDRIWVRALDYRAS